MELSCGIYPGSFTICKNNDIEPLLGIDMMSSLGLTIDFKKRCIKIEQNELPFENS